MHIIQGQCQRNGRRLSGARRRWPSEYAATFFADAWARAWGWRERRHGAGKESTRGSFGPFCGGAGARASGGGDQYTYDVICKHASTTWAVRAQVASVAAEAGPICAAAAATAVNNGRRGGRGEERQRGVDEHVCACEVALKEALSIH
jgi:hypothetical protein